MGMFKNIFTWWEGATFGTALNTFASGIRIGSDDAGNIYYQAKKLVDGKRRRWVIYSGANDASRVPPEWHGWLHNSHDDPPTQALPPARAWEKPAQANLTGTNAAYRPAGTAGSGKNRASATGDYAAWSPEP